MFIAESNGNSFGISGGSGGHGGMVGLARFDGERMIYEDGISALMNTVQPGAF